jgi:PAS domain S-box-containing protein/putative nucleotidyltransferase with HDIG domain
VQDGVTRFFNRRCTEVTGRSSEELLAGSFLDLVHPEDREMVALNYMKRVAGEDIPNNYQFRIIDKKGNTRWLQVNGVRLNWEGKPATLTMLSDVTERVMAEQAVRDSEERFRALIEKATDAVAVVDQTGKVLYYSPSLERITGYALEEWLGKPFGAWKVHPDDLASMAASLQEVLKEPGKALEGIRARYQHKDGSWHTLEATVRNLLSDPKVSGLVANFRDITERVKAEDSLRSSEERFRGLVETTSDWVWEIDRNSRYTYVSPRVRDILGYEPQEMLGHTPFQFMHQREGRRVSKILRRFSAEHLPFSLLENICTHKDGHSVVLETSAVPIIGSDGSFLGYRGIDRDITERKKVEQELQRSLKRLGKTMESTIEAITTTIETRDPYTTGHQMRVTDLACAIAKIMEVPPTQIEGIRVAGLLHDIGKIAIPTEILSKPGKLNEVEYEMIKTHSKVGYNILKKIEFPWPVARTVLQHHERWNGSGYPHGIRSEDILLEARILAVADVMEAMSSHRPYRPSIGADKALDEISQNRGILYDPAVVDACITAFTRAGFRFTSPSPGTAGEPESTSAGQPMPYLEDN